MKSASLPFAVAGLASAALLACHTGVGGHLSEPDQDRIRNVTDEATRTLTPPVSDVQAYAKLYYAEDARVLPPNGVTVTGREAIATFWVPSGNPAVRATILAIGGATTSVRARGVRDERPAPGATEPVGDKGSTSVSGGSRGTGAGRSPSTSGTPTSPRPVSPPPALSTLTPPAHD
jgi:hypothetical protein